MSEESPSKTPICVIDSEKGIFGMSREELEALENSAEQMAVTALFERLENGTATEDERIDQEIRFAELEMDRNRFKS